jgi:FAD/FMN-containing dehydrogenase
MRATTRLPETTVFDFRSAVRGAVLRPGDERYDEARRVWNGMIDRSPALIVRCECGDDVVAAVGLARSTGLELAVRGGGHNAAGLAVCEGGIVIDLSPMRAVSVNAERRTARAEGGATWGDFDRATQAHGLATPGGAISTTGIAGLTLGGGMGWLTRSYGLASDNLIRVEVVTADGRRVTASETENPDLFWGLRGGGGNFGVVTSFEYQLYPVGPTVLGGMLLHPDGEAPKVLRYWRDFVRGAPDALTSMAALLSTPDGVPAVALLVCYNGPVAQGEEVLRPLRAFGSPIADQVGPLPYTALQSMLDEGFPSGLQVYWRSDFLKALPDEAIDTMVAHARAGRPPLGAVLLEMMGGAMSRIGHDATPFDHRGAEFNFAVITRWTDPDEAGALMQWTRALSDAMRPFTSGGVYVNYLGVGEGADRVRAAYGPEKYARLAALKRKYDPTNLFRGNQNIRPEG